MCCPRCETGRLLEALPPRDEDAIMSCQQCGLVLRVLIDELLDREEAAELNQALQAA